MDNILERAEERRKHLQDSRQKLMARLAGIENELKELESFFAVASRLGAEVPADPVTQAAAAVAADQSQKVSVFFSSGSDRVITGGSHYILGTRSRTIALSARRIIKQHGPQSARRILELLDAEGLGEKILPGRDEKSRISYMSAVLSKDPAFKSDRDLGGYTLVDTEEETSKEETPPAEGQEGRRLRDLLDPK